MKRFLSLFVLLLFFAGAQTARSQGVVPVETEAEKPNRQEVDATTSDAFEKTTDETSVSALPTDGWYRIKSLAPVREEEGTTSPFYYLYSNTNTADRYKRYTALANNLMTPADGKYIWRVNTGNATTNITGSSGKGMNSYTNQWNVDKEFELTRQEQPGVFTIRPLSSSDKVFDLYPDKTAPSYGMVRYPDWALVLRRTQDDLDDYMKFEFERVEEADLPGTPYMVSVCAPADSVAKVQVSYVADEDYAGNSCVFDGGYFFLKSAPAADDFQATVLEGYRHIVVVEDTHIIVTYIRNDCAGKLYRLGRRAETLVSGKQYAIFNTSCNTDITNNNRMALLCTEEGNEKMLSETIIARPGVVVPVSHVWTLGRGDAPDLWNFRSVFTQKYAAWDVDTVKVVSDECVDFRVTEWTATDADKREINVKSLNDDGTFTANSEISTDNHVWTIGRTDGTRYWNGGVTGMFDTWPKGHPFAFYEVEEIASPDAIADVKTGGRQNTGTYDLQGRRVQQPRKGIYIRNGRKFVATGKKQ